MYILYSEKMDIYYTGSTSSLEDRLKRHNQGRSKFTKSGVPWKLVYQKEYPTKSDAYKAELHLKLLLSAKTLISPLQGLVIYQELYFYQNYGTMCLRKAS